jgi:arylsulfatase A-like enzyme
VITSDHGEELLDHGYVGHASTQCYGTLYEEVLRIPLIVIDPRAKSRTLRGRVQGLDLFSTLLGLAGAVVPASAGIDLSDAISGKQEAISRLESNKREFLFHSSRMGFRTPKEYEGHGVSAISNGEWKLIIENYGSERTMLFNLKDDPLEKDPVVNGTRVEYWRKKLLSASSPNK